MESFVLFLDLHHIIADGTSAEIILSQLTRFYAGRHVAPGEIDYKDYSVWQEENLASESHGRPTQVLEGCAQRRSAYAWAEYGLPAGGRSKHGREPALVFPCRRTLTLGLRTLAQRSGVTMFTLLLSLYTVFLSKYTGQKDIIVGVPVSLRNRHELMDIVGMFVNTLPLRKPDHPG